MDVAYSLSFVYLIEMLALINGFSVLAVGEPTAEQVNILAYLMNVAPVVVVMGLAVYELWKKNNQLTEKIHERDLANLKTLEQMLSALKQLETKADLHFNELRTHITERIATLQKDI